MKNVGKNVGKHLRPGGKLLTLKSLSPWVVYPPQTAEPHDHSSPTGGNNFELIS